MITKIVPNSELPPTLQSILLDLNGLDVEIKMQLDELAKTIDKTYESLSDIVGTSMKVGTKFMHLGFPKLSLFTIGIGVVSATAGGAFAGYSAAKHHNKMLKKLLEQKYKLASTKISATRRMLQHSQNVCLRVEQLVDAELSQTYPIKDYKKVRRQKWANMTKLMTIFKVSLYQKIVIQYLLQEYSAWLSGNQTSTYDRPNFLDVNEVITEKLSDGKGKKKLFRKMRDNPRETISSKEIFCLSDQQISSILLVEMYFNIDEHEIEKLQWPKEPFRKKMLRNNLAYIIFRRCRWALEWSKFYSRIILFVTRPMIAGTSIVGLVIWGLYTLSKYLSWPCWLEWVMGTLVLLLVIALMLVLFFIFDDYYDDIKEWRSKVITKRFNKCWRKMASLSGWIEYIKPDLERKSPTISAMVGAFNWLDK